MSSKITSIKGLFGQLIHYKDGVKVGESWPGFFEGTLKHYDANGNYLGDTSQGIIFDEIHHDAYGNTVGKSGTGIFGQKNHYDDYGRKVGSTWDGFVGKNTYLDDDDSGDSDFDF